MKKKSMRILLTLMMSGLVFSISAVPVFASGDVAGAIESAWTAAQAQIKTVWTMSCSRWWT